MRQTSPKKQASISKVGCFDLDEVYARQQLSRISKAKDKSFTLMVCAITVSVTLMLRVAFMDVADTEQDMLGFTAGMLLIVAILAWMDMNKLTTFQVSAQDDLEQARKQHEIACDACRDNFSDFDNGGEDCLQVHIVVEQNSEETSRLRKQIASNVNNDPVSLNQITNNGMVWDVVSLDTVQAEQLKREGLINPAQMDEEDIES